MNKTVREWFEQQDSPYKEVLLSRMREPNRVVSSLKDAINAFTWSNTPEGHVFWNKIYTNNAKDLSILKTIDLTKDYFLAVPTSTQDRDYHLDITDKNNYKFQIQFNRAPFNNCQNISIASFDTLITSCNTVDIIRTIKYLLKYCGKRMLIVDVHTKLVPTIKNILKEFICFEHDYESTNTSKMTIIMFKFPENYATS